MKLKFYMEQIENTVVFRIIEQEGIELENGFKAGNNIHIESYYHPNVNNTQLFLRGESENLNSITACEIFSSFEQAIDMKEKYISALKELFFSKIEETPMKRGDRIFVSDYKCINNRRHKRIFLTKIDRANLPYIAVEKMGDRLFEEGKDFNTMAWKYAWKAKCDIVFEKEDGNIYTITTID